MNKCYECMLRTTRASFGVHSLFISHIQEIVTDAKKSYPNVKFLIWDDMMRGIPEESLMSMYKLIDIYLVNI